MPHIGLAVLTVHTQKVDYVNLSVMQTQELFVSEICGGRWLCHGSLFFDKYLIFSSKIEFKKFTG